MNIDQYVTGILPALVASTGDGFDMVFEHIQNEQKVNNKGLLVYIDWIVEQLVINESDAVQYEHLHIELVTEDQIDLISEFLILKFFYIAVLADAGLSDPSPLNDRIANLDKSIAKEITANSDSKGTSKALQALIAEKKQFKRSRKFFDELRKAWPNISLAPKTLVNLSKKEAERLSSKLGSYPFSVRAKALNDNNAAYVVLNEGNLESLKNIKFKEVPFLKMIENVLLINSSSKSEFGKFSLRDLIQLNHRSRTVFKKLLIISFNERSTKFSRLKATFDRIHSRYNSMAQYPKYGAYTIIPAEVAQLTGQAPVKKVAVSFFGSAHCDLWDNALTTIDRYEGLEELRSSKLMDIYAIVVNTKIRDVIIDELFSPTKSTQLVTDGTKDILGTLGRENLLWLKNDMLLFFDWIIGSGWPSNLLSVVNSVNTIILSGLLLKHTVLRDELTVFLGLTQRQKLTSWYVHAAGTPGRTLILDYVDLGPIPNTYKNNLVEFVQHPDQVIHGEFLAIFYERRYQWSLYNYSRHLYNILDHPIRTRSFAWASLNSKLLAGRPNGQQVNFDMESRFDNYQSQQSTVIMTAGSRPRTFHPSELFIVSELGTQILMAKRLEDLSIYDISAGTLEAQCLTELYADFNIYEKMADHVKEELELQIIRESYHLQENYTAKQLWKVLLRDKVIELGADVVYEQIKRELLLKNRQIVDKGHFLSVWVNPDSDTLLARGKSIFLGICDHLKLPKSYMRIMSRIYNAEKLNKSRSSRKMNLLLSDLINDGCFNEVSSPQIIISKEIIKYIKEHDLESIGISGTRMVEELSSLVSLLKPQLNLKLVKKIDYN